MVSRSLGWVAMAACLSVTACTEPAKRPPAVAQSAGSPAAELAEAKRLESEATRLRGDARSALPMAYRALEIRRRLLGDASPDTWRITDLIASIHYTTGDYDDAQKALEFELSAKERALGPSHYELASPLAGLATIAESRSQSAQAEGYRRRRLAILEAILGPNHPDVAVASMDLARILNTDCRGADALPLVEQAIRVQEAVFGPTSADLAEPWSQLAEARRITGDDGGAAAAQRRVVGLLANREADRGDALVTALTALAKLSEAKSQQSEAIAWADRALDVIDRGARVGDGTRVKSAVALWDLYRTARPGDAKDKALARLGVTRFERSKPTWMEPLNEPGATPARCTKSNPRGATTSGGSVENAGEVVKGVAAGFRRCFNAVLKSDPNASGTIRVIARIDASGEVARAVGFAGLPLTSGVACVVDAVFAAKFSPPQGGGATIEIPVTIVSR